jgi:uncharacterized membrane protein (UPF0127 family)
VHAAAHGYDRSMRSWSPGCVLALCAAAAFSLVACGGDRDDNAPATVTAAATSSATTEATAVPTAAASPTNEATASPTVTTPAETGEPVASTASIPQSELSMVEFAVDGVDAGTLGLEVPSRDEYSVGLSGRTELGERGMLFDYGVPDHTGPFWMKDTHYDLDIAFVGGDARIVTIRHMEAESLDLVESDAPYQWAIEAPSGWYEARGIGVGAEVRFQFDTPSVLGTP